MNTRGERLVRVVVDAHRSTAWIAGVGVPPLLDANRIGYRTLGRGAVVIDLGDLPDFEAACAASSKAVRITARKPVAR